MTTDFEDAEPRFPQSTQESPPMSQEERLAPPPPPELQPYKYPVYPDPPTEEEVNSLTGRAPVEIREDISKGFEVKDSGFRVEYPSGMRRDTQDGKPRYSLLPMPMLTRWAEHMTKGAEKYGAHNWQLANSETELDRFRDSAFRHLIQWLNGERDEDHAAAVLFNISAAEHVLNKLNGQGDR